MADIPLHWLFIVLLILLVLSGFCSSTETALMSVNRYRLRHLAREGSVAARTAEKLLESPDRLIGVILVCNNFVNSAAAAIVTVISLSLGGEAYAFVGVSIFTVVLIIFGEIAPKTYGALYPERLALPAAIVYHRMVGSNSNLRQRMFWGYRNQLSTLLKLYQPQTLYLLADPISRRWFRTRSRPALQGTLAALSMLPGTIARRRPIQHNRRAPDLKFLELCNS